MRSVHIFILVLFQIEFSYCHIKNMGEVTNFSLSIDKLLSSLAVPPKNTKLIVGGSKANPRDVPHNVVFLNFETVCEGSIISDKIVLTAAHCLEANGNLLEMRIFAGSRYLFDPNADVHMVWDFIIHDKYDDPVKYANDAALLIINDKFRFKDTVQKALLINHKNWMREGSVIKAVGWGDSRDGTERTLQIVDLDWLPLTECNRKGGEHLAPDSFCLFSEDGRGTCRSDAGSGALWNKMIVGVGSHGGGCGAYPEVYTNVFYLRPWIQISSEKLYHRFCHFHDSNHGDY